MIDTAKKILLIDDELEIACLVKARLESKGYEVDMAYSGEEGLEKIKDFKPDLVILDVMLPGKSGYEVCNLIKSDQEITVPVLMLTSRNQRVDEHLGFLCKADAYIRKPMSSELLLPEVKRLLENTAHPKI